MHVLIVALVITKGKIALGQDWIRHLAITQTNADSSSIMFCGINLTADSLQALTN